MRTSTPPTPAMTWYLVDAEGSAIGRIAATIAHVLRGKHLVTFSPHLATKDHVIVINVEKMAVSTSKLRRKTYYHHTGYPGHVKVTGLGTMLAEQPDRVLSKAVYGMLPRNRLRPLALKRLHIMQGGEHRFQAQKPVPLTLSRQ